MIPIQEQDCYITRVVNKKTLATPLVWYFKKHYALPYGKTYKQAARAEKLKGVCTGCGEANETVDWIFSDDGGYYEVKNACEDCIDCGLLYNEDCANLD